MSSIAPSPSTGGGSAVPPPVGKNGTSPSSSPPTSSPPRPASSSPVSAPPPSPLTTIPITKTAPPPSTTNPVPPTANSPLPASGSSAPPPSAPPPSASPPPPPPTSPAPTNTPPPPSASPPPPTNNPPPPSASPPPPTPTSPPPASPPIASPPPPSTPANPAPPPTAPIPSTSSNPSPSIVHSPSPLSTPSPPPPKSSPPSASPSNSPPPPRNAPTPKASPPAPKTSGSPAPPTPSSPPPASNSSTNSNSTPSATPSPPAHNSSGGATSIVVGAAVAGLVVLALCGVLIWYIRKKKRRDGYLGDNYGPPPPGSISYKSDGMYASVSRTSEQYPVKVSPSPSTPRHGSSGTAGVGVPPSSVDTPGLGNSSWFTYEELAIATNGFSPQNVLGEGGFGCVYKGYLPDGKVVAVKQLKVGSGQGEREFRAEVEIISRVHHRHLVSLVGYCIADSQRLLVYDYVPNGTLEYHLHGGQRLVMDWATRMRIALGAARGIAYLHEDCHPRIIHRDIKGSNILLDDRFEAQVSDFGLAKLASDTNTHVTTRVMGTFGYMAPEYASSGKLTVRSDVFSFGVVLLELMTGRKPVDVSQPLGDESLVEWARPLLSRALEEGNFEELADPRLENKFDGGEMFRMVEAAAACVRHSARRRPAMGQVVRALESNAAIADLNNGVKPGESVMYNSAQYSADIRRFQRMAFGSRENPSDFDFSEVNSEYETNLSASSTEFRKSKELEARQTRLRKSEVGMPFACGSESPSSGESETRPINRSRFYRDGTSEEKSSGEAPIPINCKSLRGR